MNRMMKLPLIVGTLVAVLGVVAIIWLCMNPVVDRFGNPTDPMDPSSPSGPKGAAGGPGVTPSTTEESGLFGATTRSETSSPLDSPDLSPVPFRGWNPSSPPTQGQVPSAKQTSAISNTLPMSSVADSSQSIAQNTDIVATMDMIDIYTNLVENTNTALMTDAGRQQIKETTSAIADMRPDLIAARLNPAAATVTVAGLSALRSRIQATIVKVRQQPRIEGFESPVAGVSAAALGSLATALATALTTLGPKATATDAVKKRIEELETLQTQLTATRASVTADTTALAKVPITQANADLFLAATLTNTATPLPTLYTPAGVSAAALDLLKTKLATALTTLRAKAARTTAEMKRTNDLEIVNEQVVADIASVAASTAALAKVPITQANADLFLAATLTDTATPLPTLYTKPAGVTIANLALLETAITAALATLGPKAATTTVTKTRIEELEALKTQVVASKASVTADTTALAKVPITQANADLFLAATLTNTATPLPTLYTKPADISLITLGRLTRALEDALTTLGPKISATTAIKTRIEELEAVKTRVAADVASGTAALAKVPITRANAEAFLAATLTDTATPLPTLYTTAAATVITVTELLELVRRILLASAAITALGTTDATLTQRKVTLDRMAADISDMITKVNKGDLEISKVPITPAAATAFLATVDDRSTPLGTLTTTLTTISSSTTDDTLSIVQSLLPSVQDTLSGIKFRISYDPAFAQRADIMKRLQALEDKLFLYASTSTPIPTATMTLLQQELTVLGAIAGIRPSPSTYCPTNSLPTTGTRTTDNNSTAEYPSLSQLASATGQGFMQTGLTDDQIRRRGSLASFDPTTVGGLDYKARSVEMCRQIKVEYGNNKTFGCVQDPDSVGSNYSWKGNFTSVCNRIGDVWGGRAGEKYGCPPFNPAAKFSTT